MKYAKNLTSDHKIINGTKTRRADTDTSDYNYDDLPKLTSDVLKIDTGDTSKVMTTVTEKIPQTSNKIIKTKSPKTANKDLIQNTATLPTTVKPFMKITNQTKNTKYQTNNDIPKFVNKNKVQKFRNFMEKNKGLLKNFLDNKMKETSKITSKSPLRQNELDLDKIANSVESSSEVGGAIRNVDKLYKKDELPLASPDLLDLAPARGGRIHQQRVKGRLCQRHVLVPEGPKYDSQGKWYLPAHKLIVRRPYNVTHRPKLVLPRCCNCCKKSVLGCE
ncbi:unnamed protein product [Danaus chrysippus]|uniref:(African queen) hypothetical protein n=1 Tax=Danaus chrysippus TaxID=151541 RepID=A0A8J2W5R5_9NEOP|nr:unnamed protein product [Danaus chrysippus]